MKSSGDSWTILFSDDVDTLLSLERSFLSRSKSSLLKARSGVELLGLALKHRPDLILVDMFMPDMDGATVCGKLKGDRGTAAIPVIVVSSDPSEEARYRALCGGCDGFLAKPLQREEFIALVESRLHIPHRRHPRARVDLRATLSLEGEQLDTRMLSLGAGGVFLELEPPPATGNEGWLTFELPGDGVAIRCRASVRWGGRLSEEDPPGAGMAFTELDEARRRDIERYVRGCNMTPP